MFLILRVTCTVICALCVAAAIPVGLFTSEWGYAGLCAFVAILFFILMRLFKTRQELQELQEGKTPTSTDRPDFISPSKEKAEANDTQNVDDRQK